MARPRRPKLTVLVPGLSLGPVTSEVDPDTGALSVSVPILDDDDAQGTLAVSFDTGRNLVVSWNGAEGGAPLVGFQAWSTS